MFFFKWNRVKKIFLHFLFFWSWRLMTIISPFASDWGGHYDPHFGSASFAPLIQLIIIGPQTGPAVANKLAQIRIFMIFGFSMTFQKKDILVTEGKCSLKLCHFHFYSHFTLSCFDNIFSKSGLHRVSLRISLIKSGFQQNRRKTYFCANCKFSSRNIRAFCKNKKYERQHFLAPQSMVLPNIHSKTRTLGTEYCHMLLNCSI